MCTELTAACQRICPNPRIVSGLQGCLPVAFKACVWEAMRTANAPAFHMLLSSEPGERGAPAASLSVIPHRLSVTVGFSPNRLHFFSDFFRARFGENPQCNEKRACLHNSPCSRVYFARDMRKGWRNRRRRGTASVLREICIRIRLREMSGVHACVSRMISAGGGVTEF